MSLEPGRTLAHYEILEPIGKGGMGEVYRAKDSKLGRGVAIKVLPEEFARDAERLTRFKREGIFNRATGRSFVESILSRGDSADPDELFREFMGRDPDAEALLTRNLGAPPA